MAFTFQQLKQAKQNIMESFGLSAPDASRVVGFFSGSPDTVQAIVNNDLAGVPSALSALGLAPQGTAQDQAKDQTQDQRVQDHAGKQTSQDHATQGTARKQCAQDQEPRKDQRKNLVSRKAPAGRKRSAQAVKPPQALPQVTALDCPQECAHDCGKDQGTAQRSAGAPDIQTDDIIQDPIGDQHALPAGLYDDICATIEYYCDTHNINDCQKIHPIQWRAVCMSIGSGIKSRKLLYDMEYLKIKGGKKYDDSKVLSLLFLYDRICADYKQVAFMHNFPPFAGVSREYLNDYMQRDLTSTQCGLRQKAYDLQRASLVGAVTSGGSATVGNIFLSKALAGLQETVTVQHVSAATAPQVTALPVFDDGGALLPDNGGEK